MENPFGYRASRGEYEPPFHMELNNPTKEEVEAYAATKGAAVQATSWVDILVRPRNGIEVPARVRLDAGIINGVYFPDGTIAEWGNRVLGAVDFACNEWQCATAAQLGPIPEPNPEPESAPANNFREPLLRERDESVAPQESNLWPYMTAIGIIFTLCVIGLTIWAFSQNTTKETSKDTATSSTGLKTKPSTGGAGANINTDDVPDPNAPKAFTVIHGELKVTLACEPGNREILCAGLIANIGNDDGDFYITGTDYPKHGWARTGNEGPARIIVDAEHFQLADRTHWNNWHVWMPAKSVTRFWFSYESRNPDAAKTAHIDLDMMWGGDNSLGFDLPSVPINRTTYHSLDQ